jgi:DNA-binding NtrC family response regulator
VAEAAELLQVSKKTLYDKMKRLGISTRGQDSMAHHLHEAAPFQGDRAHSS